jgi:cell division septal protein FtsQ
LREKVRQAKARGDAFDKYHLPPVMVRGNVVGTPLPVRKSAKSKAKRRYDVSLSMPGAEMRLPSLPQISVDLRLLSFVLVAALGALLYQLWNSPTFRVEDATIVGLLRINSRDVNTILDVEGESIFAIDPQALERSAMEAFPEFASVKVEVSLPRHVDVMVEERIPILTWRQEGRTVLVDANGVAFPQRELGGATPAVVIEASSSPPVMQQAGTLETNASQFVPVEMVSAILSMNGQAPKDTLLVYDAKHGLGWKDPRGWNAYFGNIKDIDMKLRVYNAMLEKLKKDDVQPVLISLEYVHAPYYRLEN